MTNPTPEAQGDTAEPQPPVVEVFVGILLFIASIFIAFHAWNLNSQSKTFTAIESAGLSIMVAGGSINPINFIWLCLPFTRKEIAPPAKFAFLSWIICGVGFIPFTIGLVGRHMTV